jgi:hypothetical protein
VVNRGQLLEYEQQAPQAWQGLASPVTAPMISIAVV